MEVSFAPGALADFREGSNKPYGDTEEDALAAEMDMTTGLLEDFIAHSAAWEALEVAPFQWSCIPHCPQRRMGCPSGGSLMVVLHPSRHSMLMPLKTRPCINQN